MSQEPQQRSVPPALAEDAPAPRLTPRERALGLGVLLATSLAMVWPMFGALEDDSFPISTYPMFAKQRGKALVNKLVAFDGNDGAIGVGPELLGTSEVLQAKRLIDDAARQSKRGRSAFCRKLLARAETLAAYRDVERLELWRVRFEPLEYFSNGGAPIEQKRLARCQRNSKP